MVIPTKSTIYTKLKSVYSKVEVDSTKTVNEVILMELNDFGIVMGFFGTVATAIATIVVARTKTKAETFAVDRQLLAQESAQLRQDYREDIRLLRDEVARWSDRYTELDDELKLIKQENKELRRELSIVKEENNQLREENARLVDRVNELELYARR